MDILLSIAVDGELETTPKGEVPAMVSLMVAVILSVKNTAYCTFPLGNGSMIFEVRG